MTNAAPLQRLPVEILLHVLSYLDLDAPSVRDNAQDPDIDQAFNNHSWTPLKALSLTSRQLYRFVIPLLHKCLRVRFEELQECLPWFISFDSEDAAIKEAKRRTDLPRHYPSEELSAQATSVPFFSFLRKHNLNDGIHPVSLLLYTRSVFEHEEITEECELWNCLFQHLDAQRVVIICPPALMGAVARNRVYVQDHWAFSMPHQRMVLEQDKNRWLGRKSEDDYHSIRMIHHERMSRVLYRTLFQSRLWDAIKYDGGSSLNAYGTYHYFEKDDALVDPDPLIQRPPCILSRLNPLNFSLAHTLRSLTYTAIFPHVAHFRDVVWAFSLLPCLRHLAVQLVPDPNDARSVLGNDDLVNRGNLRISDCWNEAEWCYQYLVDIMITGFSYGDPNHTWRGPSLANIEVLESRDVAVTSVAMLLDRSIEPAEGWEKTREGLYSRTERIPLEPSGQFALLHI
ncbi:MAG: hypothetical protein M1831_006865 [Alyxoria varia]|nr:MAG: hypothetical protein M1831_006865 [Alyxoria varia]